MFPQSHICKVYHVAGQQCVAFSVLCIQGLQHVPSDLSNTCGGRLHVWPVPVPTAKQLLSGRGHPCGNERTKGVNKIKAANVT